MRLQDTVCAISTPPGRGGLGVVRISGPAAFRIAGQILSLRKPLAVRVATLARLHDEGGELIDETVATCFKAPASFTGEDVVEISCHGSPVILRHCLSRAVQAGARLAEPGEFTLRAFINGRIDLPRAEAVKELIESTTLHQARIAAQQTQGSVSKQLTPIKSQLLELISLLEAGIDFAEDDISVAPAEEILRRLEPIIAGVELLAGTAQYGRLVREGFSLAIVGLPNAGKSSLFNCLLRQERAIVTDIPGTTRDLVSETAEIDGIPVRLVDTAGVRETAETIERLGIEKTFEAMADADLTLVVLDGSRPLLEDEQILIEKAREQGRFLVIVNKKDLAEYFCSAEHIPVSARTGDGIEELKVRIMGLLAPERDFSSRDGIVTSVRHQSLLRESLELLRKGREAAGAGLPHELLLLDLYCGLRPLDELTGATTADDILNRIFSSFCIGK